MTEETTTMTDCGFVREHPSIYTLMARVQSDIGVVGRNSENSFHKYRYRSVDDLANALHSALTRHDVVMVPSLVESRYENLPGKKEGSVNFRALLTMSYVFYGPRGDYVVATMPGEGIDGDTDKATNKALSAAYKYAIMQTFSIPTEDIEDSDAGVPSTPTVEMATPGQRESLKALFERIGDPTLQADTRTKFKEMFKGKYGTELNNLAELTAANFDATFAMAELCVSNALGLTQDAS